jgi:pimeloyl-ACP methyl ester carboxylesterase
MSDTVRHPLSPGRHDMIVDGVRQVYHVAGSGPVIVAHSGGPGVYYEYLRSPELEQHFTMVYVEPVGTGESGRLDDPADYGMDVYVRFLASLIIHLGTGPVLVLGHSYGGCVAQQLALDHPALVAGLVLYDSTPVLDPEFVTAAFEAASTYPDRFPDKPEAVAVTAAFLGPPPVDDESAAKRTRAVAPLYFADYWSNRAAFEARLAQHRSFAEPGRARDSKSFDVRGRLAEITAPTVVIVGRHDFICGPRWAAQLHEGIRGSRLEMLENSGHFGHLEEPAAFVAAVSSLRMLLDEASGAAGTD